MPWFRVDDSFHSHRKVLAVPRGPRRLQAIGAWTVCGAWSSANLTEGFIPGGLVAELHIPSRAALDLAAAGLWHAVDGGYQMHDYLEYNPTAEQVQKDREAAAERQRKAREKARNARQARLDGEVNNETDIDSHGVTHTVTHGGTHGVSHGPPDPTRPDPYLSLVLEDEEVQEVELDGEVPVVHGLPASAVLRVVAELQERAS